MTSDRRPQRPSSIAELREVAQPPSVISRRNAEHWLGILYGRKLSIYLTYWFVRAGVSANTVTWLMLVVGLAGSAALLVEGILGPVIAAFLIQLHLVLDCSDGEVARWTRTTSATGVYLDRFAHYVVEASFFVFLGLRVGGEITSPEGVVGLLTAILALLVKAETDLIASARATAGMPPLEDSAPEYAQRSLVGSVRRVVSRVGIHRLLGAVEASLLVLLAAVIQVTAPQSNAERVALFVFVAVASLMVVAHLASVLLSDRLA